MNKLIAFLVGITLCLQFVKTPVVIADSKSPEIAFQQEAATPAPVGGVVVATPGDDGSITHVVKEGESLWAIAVSYGVTIAEIQAMNGLTTQDVRANMPLIIRLPFTPTVSPTPTEVPTNTAIPTATEYVEAATATVAPQDMPEPTDLETPADAKKPLLNDTTIGMVLIGGSLLGLVLLGISMIRGK